MLWELEANLRLVGYHGHTSLEMSADLAAAAAGYQEATRRTPASPSAGT